mmetsp:Transcript_8782/g.19128  ORF Transcript_8782/g.19128 Transcript_8782/m.19128 type:complete len:241 (-) Transcript_8782:101-823(-)
MRLRDLLFLIASVSAWQPSSPVRLPEMLMAVKVWLDLIPSASSWQPQTPKALSERFRSAIAEFALSKFASNLQLAPLRLLCDKSSRVRVEFLARLLSNELKLSSLRSFPEMSSDLRCTLFPRLWAKTLKSSLQLKLPDLKHKCLSAALLWDSSTNAATPHSSRRVQSSKQSVPSTMQRFFRTWMGVSSILVCTKAPQEPAKQGWKRFVARALSLQDVLSSPLREESSACLPSLYWVWRVY